jgi:hypothetical protein
MASNHLPFGNYSFQDCVRSQPQHPPFGTGNRDRTCDLTIIGRLLYQLSYTRTYLTVYRVTGKLTTRAGFISDSLARGLLPLPHSLGLVSDYNPSTHLLCSRISQVSCLTLHLPVGFPCPSVNREAKRVPTMRKNILAKVPKQKSGEGARIRTLTNGVGSRRATVTLHRHISLVTILINVRFWFTRRILTIPCRICFSLTMTIWTKKRKIL